MYLEIRPIVQSSVNNRFQEAFIQKIIGPSLLNVRHTGSLTGYFTEKEKQVYKRY